MSDVTLYYFPASFYSLKALLALNEKQATFNERLVNIHGGDQYAEWFLRINKYGEVPVLQIGNQYTSGSEEIIDLVDKTFPHVLDPSTPYGRELGEFRQTMQDIPIDCITFGLLANRQYCAGEMKLPKFMANRFNKEGIVKNFTSLAKKYAEEEKTCPPDLREAFRIKHEKVTARCTLIQDEKAVAKILDSLEPILDMIEGRLKKSQQVTVKTR